MESGNRDNYEFTVYKCWILPIFTLNWILNVDSLSLYHCLERTNLMNLCPTSLYSLGINSVLLHCFKLKMDEGSFQ